VEGEPISAGTFVVFAAGAGAVAALLLAVGEAIGVQFFNEWVFRLGPVVLRETRVLPPPSSRTLLGEVFRTAGGRFKLVAPNICLFRRKSPFFGYIRTPFPIKGSVRWRGDLAEVEGRIPLFPTLFFVAWLAGWTVGMVLVALSVRRLLGPLGFGLLGWAFAGGVGVFSVSIERARARSVVTELERKLQHAAA
jgi:hypothetical protein